MGLTTLSQSCEWAFLVHNDLCVVVHNLDDKTISVISQNCVLSATIALLICSPIQSILSQEMSQYKGDTHTHTSVPGDRAPTLLIVARHLWVARTPERDNPGGVRDTCGHCGRLGHWDPDRGAAPRLPQYVKVILALTTSTTLFCFSCCCWYSQQHFKPR